MGGIQDDNITFAVLLYAYIIAKEAEDKQRPDQPQTQQVGFFKKRSQERSASLFPNILLALSVNKSIYM